MSNRDNMLIKDRNRGRRKKQVDALAAKNKKRKEKFNKGSK